MAFQRFLLIAALLAVCGCGKAPPDERPFLTRTYQTPDGDIAHYVLFVPPGRDPAEKLPVILFLNGWGENGNDGLRQISNNFGGDLWRMRAWFPFLAVCPQCNYNAEWIPGSKNAELALAVLDQAILEFNGDPERVSVTGASTGGTGALNLAIANPDRFAAAFPIATSIQIPPSQIANSRIPIWNLYNGGDSPSLVQQARRARKHQFEAGASPLVTEFEQHGHNAWDAAYSSPALYRWLLQQRSDAQDPFLPYRLIQPAELVTQWASETAAWTADEDDIVPPPGRSSASLISPPLSGDWALHFDVELGRGLPAHVSLSDSDDQAIDLTVPLADEGFLQLTFPNEPPHRGSPFAQRALRTGWNEIRLQAVAGQLSVLLNGWTAVEEAPLRTTGPLRLTLRTPAGQSAQRFRFVRHSQRTVSERAPQ